MRVDFAQALPPAMSNRSKPNKGIFVGVVSAVFTLALLFSSFTSRVPMWILGVYIGASLLTFFAYLMDKRAATKGEWRTQESTLHMMALFCGWPGAYAAQQLTRHKTIKAEFQLIFKATVLLNFFAFVLVASPSALHGLTLLLGGH